MNKETSSCTTAVVAEKLSVGEENLIELESLETSWPGFFPIILSEAFLLVTEEKEDEETGDFTSNLMDVTSAAWEMALETYEETFDTKGNNETDEEGEPIDENSDETLLSKYDATVGLLCDIFTNNNVDTLNTIAKALRVSYQNADVGLHYSMRIIPGGILFSWVEQSNN